MKTTNKKGPLPATARQTGPSTADRKQALQIKTILVPLDFSRASMQALKYAIPLAEKFRRHHPPGSCPTCG